MSPEPTIQSPEPTIQSPEPTIQSPEPTSSSPESTIQSSEPTTRSSESTTQSPESTTQSPESTTQSPGSTSPSPEPTIQLYGNPPVTYKDAINEDGNLIHDLELHDRAIKLVQTLLEAEDVIKKVVLHHVDLTGSGSCRVSPTRFWIKGKFNICIPVVVRTSPEVRLRLVLRCAMPHQVAEAQYPGTIDEKISAEVATYGWVQKMCPDIRVPHLYGFGFLDHQQYTHKTHRPLYVRALHHLRRLYHYYFGDRMLSDYVRHPARQQLPTAYLLLENISSDNSQMLSNTWNKYRQDPDRRGRLFRGLARTMLSLASVPHTRIGSFQFHRDGTISLSNRPLMTCVTLLENQGTPRTIRNGPYLSRETFVSDLFDFHDSRLLNHPNAVYDDTDCRENMGVKVLLRALAHHFVDKNCREGPFLLQLDDLHASNIFVDDDWNITSMIDLEWISALPTEKMGVPYWLTGCGINELRNEKLTEFEPVRQEFLRILEEEQRSITSVHNLSLAQTFDDNWKTGRQWFWYCLSSVNAMTPLFEQHLRRRYVPDRLLFREDKLLSRFWSEGADEIVETKVDQYRAFAKDLKQLFAERGTTPKSDP